MRRCAFIVALLGIVAVCNAADVHLGRWSELQWSGLGNDRLASWNQFQWPNTNLMSFLYTFENGPNGAPTNANGQYWDFGPIGTNFLIPGASTAAPTYVPQPTGQDWTASLYFDGINDEAACGSKYFFNGATAVTWSAWIRTDRNTQGQYAPLASYRGSRYNFSQYDDGAVYLRTIERFYAGAIDMQALCLGITYTKGNWMHFAMSASTDSILRVQINGWYKTQIVAAASGAFLQDDLFKIATDDAGGRFSQAYYDNVAMWTNWAASFGEMTNIYLGALNPKIYQHGGTNMTYLLTFNENTNAAGRWVSASGSGFTATNSGIGWTTNLSGYGCITGTAAGKVIFDDFTDSAKQQVTDSFWQWSQNISSGDFWSRSYSGVAGSQIYYADGSGNIQIYRDNANITSIGHVTGVWQHVAVVQDSWALTVYTNGIVATSVAMSVTIPQRGGMCAREVYLMNRLASGVAATTKALDDARVCQCALTSNEVYQIYLSGTNEHNATWVPIE